MFKILNKLSYTFFYYKDITEVNHYHYMEEIEETEESTVFKDYWTMQLVDCRWNKFSHLHPSPSDPLKRPTQIWNENGSFYLRKGIVGLVQSWHGNISTISYLLYLLSSTLPYTHSVPLYLLIKSR